MELVTERHIVQSKDVRGNKPRLADTRITVSDVVMWHFRLGYSLEEVAVKFDLSLASVYAAISYYYDHKSDIDTEIEASRAYYDKQKQLNLSLVKQKLNLNSDE
jgi:uncharacterized protein (DUF433 family)